MHGTYCDRSFFYSVRNVLFIRYERLARGPGDPLVAKTSAHMDVFADDGLRTLACCSRAVTAGEYAAFSKEYNAAQADVREVEKRKRKEPNRIDAAMDKIERRLTLLGGTAIEDRLQDGVPATIKKLAEAGIKIWMLTGDKQEPVAVVRGTP